MRTTLNISLPKNLRKWVDDQVADGGYGSASEFFRDLVRRERDRKSHQLEEIETKLLEGLQSGPATPMTKRDWHSLQDKIKKKSARRRA